MDVSCTSSPEWLEKPGGVERDHLPRALEERTIPAELRAFFVDLGDAVYRPVFEAERSKRWERLQDVLAGPMDALQRAPSPPCEATEATEYSGRAVELYALSLSRDFEDDMAAILEKGAKYRKRRNALLDRRGDALAGEYASMSHTAANGFLWALLFIGMSGFYTQEFDMTLEEDCWDFVVFVLDLGGIDQYRLLRVAENHLIDEETEVMLVDEGETNSEASLMESEAHRSWLEVQQ